MSPCPLLLLLLVVLSRTRTATPTCNPSLTHIDLSDNELGDVGANWIGEALVVQNNKLNRLGLAFNGITDNGMATLCMGLRCCSSLEAFDIGNNMIQNAGCVLLCNELTNLSVTELNVGDNGGGTTWFQSIQYCCSYEGGTG